MLNFHNPVPNSIITGWPWELEKNDKSQPMEVYPKITIITPSFNQGIFIEDTIRSIILQEYPNLEYFIFDGGSEDESLEIIQKYEKHITYWESEPDLGQAHAINKGLLRCTGDIVGWINSDDLLLPGALFTIAKNYILHSDRILLGDVININYSQNMTKIIHQKQVNFRNMITPFITPMKWHQPGVIVPTKFLGENLLLDESLRYFFDQDWLIRLLQKHNVFYINEPIAIFRLHKNSKTVGEKFNWLPEQEIIIKRYWNFISEKNKNKTLSYLQLFAASSSLGVKKWDRKTGQQKLKRAFNLYPKIIFSWKFLEFSIRSILPFQLISWSRTLLINLKIFSPDD